MGKNHNKKKWAQMVELNGVETNTREYLHQLNNLMKLAMNRFVYKGLPDEIDARFIERVFIREGSLIFFFFEELDKYMVTRYSCMTPLDIYDNPTSFRAIANNGFTADVAPDDAIVGFDNALRIVTTGSIELYAQRLADVIRTSDTNRFHQKKPYIITAPEEKVQDMRQMIMNIRENDSMIVGLSGISDIQVNTISTQSPFIGKDLADQYYDLFTNICSFLGIICNRTTGGNTVANETKGAMQATLIARQDYLEQRKIWCENINKRYNLNVSVDWNPEIDINLDEMEDKDMTAGTWDGGNDE